VYLAGKGVYGFLTDCKVQASFAAKSSSFPQAGERISHQKLDSPKAYTGNRP
jgi:hypothetical protein